jgi:predicted PhzF superfamily epimerase YddE/YHI9
MDELRFAAGEQGLNVVLFPESSRISEHFYVQRDGFEPDFGPKVEPPFEGHATLACIANSLKFHTVRAIVTVADTYETSTELYMSDLDKRRLGIH